MACGLWTLRRRQASPCIWDFLWRWARMRSSARSRYTDSSSGSAHSRLLALPFRQAPLGQRSHPIHSRHCSTRSLGRMRQGGTLASGERKTEMAKRNGNREAGKPKQDKENKVQAATTISELGLKRARRFSKPAVRDAPGVDSNADVGGGSPHIAVGHRGRLSPNDRPR